LIDSSVDFDRDDALTDALARCYVLIGRREHSTAELRARLARGRFDPATIDAAVALVAQQGYLDDARYARLLAEDRRAIDGWGVERIRARLVRAGVERELIDAALADYDEQSELAAATALLRRRFPTPPDSNPERQRAYALLVRQGYDSDLAYEAIRAHECSAPERQAAAD
jgi:regulatory protein